MCVMWHKTQQQNKLMINNNTIFFLNNITILKYGYIYNNRIRLITIKISKYSSQCQLEDF